MGKNKKDIQQQQQLSKKQQKQLEFQQQQQAKKDDRKQNKQQNNYKKKKNKRGSNLQWQVSETYTKFFQQFQLQLKEFQVYMRDVKGDGNCLFRSIADQIDGDEDMHGIYRNIAVEYIDKQKEYFQNFIDDQKVSDYLKEMSQDGEWGGNLELQALCQALNLNCVIHMKDRPAMIINSNISKEKSRTIHVAYQIIDDIGEHYCSVRNIGDDTKDPAAAIKNPIFQFIEEQIDIKNNGKQDKQNYEDEEYFDQYEEAEEDFTAFEKQQKQQQIEDTEESILAQQIQEIQLYEQNQQMQKEKEENKEPQPEKQDKIQQNNQQQDQQAQINQKEDEEEKEIQQPQNDQPEFKEIYPNYPKNKKCPCGSKINYKNCCLKKAYAQQQLKEDISKSKGILFI